ncbi:MAG: HlyD family efflux transporter periplasmic adaptor subunit [Synoicihabitans sp.]
MPTSPFRQDALDSMVSTEELDQASRSIAFQGKLLLILVGVLLLTATVLTFVITVPVKVTGPGVLWSRVGVRQVTATGDGRLIELNVRTGGQVEAGQIIARLDQNSLSQQLASAQANLDALQTHIALSENLQLEDESARAAFNQRVDELIAASERTAKIKTARLSERRDQLEALQAAGMLEAERFNQLISQIEDSEERLVTLQRETVTQLKQEHLTDFQQQREVLSMRLQAAQLQTDVELLQAQLASKGVLRTPISGRVVETMTAVGDYLTPGMPVIVVQSPEATDDLSAVVFVPTQLAKPIRVGMDVELELPAFTKSLYGKLLGEVEAVSPLPVSTSGLMRELRNDRLVQTISEQGSPILVRVRLKTNPETGQFMWSSNSPVERALQPGMAATGGVVIRKERIIDLLLPETW